jgi:hypothetical protein
MIEVVEPKEEVWSIVLTLATEIYTKATNTAVYLILIPALPSHKKLFRASALKNMISLTEPDSELKDM